MMVSKGITHTLCALSFAICAGIAGAQEIERVPYTVLEQELVARIDFEDLPRIPSPGKAVDQIMAFQGAQIAERFRGQLVAQDAGFDAFLSDPSAPLVLEVGPPGQNLAIEFVYFMSNQIMGTAPPGFPERDGGGEGAVSILFDRDQSALGFRVASEPKPRDGRAKGRILVAFFRRDGSLISEVEVELDWMLGAYGFQRRGGVEDIAGVSITNRDPQGVMFDDVIFDRNLVMGLLRP